MAKRKGTPVDPAFALFQQGAPEWKDDEPVEKKADATAQNGGGNEAAIRALQEQISMLREMNQRSARASSALMSQQLETPPKVITEISLDGLPDPVTDPQGYAKELARRGSEMVASQRNYDIYMATSAQKRNEAINGVWEQFGKEHPEYAAHTKLFGAAAQNVINAAKAKNINTDKLVLGDTSNFFEDVMNEMRDLAGGDALFKVEAGEDDENGVDTGDAGGDNLRSASLENDGDDEGRTAGVFGGADSGNKPAGQRKDEDIDMFADLKKWQAETGWHI